MIFFVFTFSLALPSHLVFIYCFYSLLTEKDFQKKKEALDRYDQRKSKQFDMERLVVSSAENLLVPYWRVFDGKYLSIIVAYSTILSSHHVLSC